LISLWPNQKKEGGERRNKSGEGRKKKKEGKTPTDTS